MASLYVHIPFCEHKCIYCDFFSVALPGPDISGTSEIEIFLHALEKEIELRAGEPRFRKEIETIFFGGGTPSILDASSLEKILGLLSARFPVRQDAEITLEANPGTVDLQKLRAFRSAGINRISLGVQSFDDADLRFLSRIHNSDEARQCIGDVYKAGFENLSIDMIFSLPGQTVEKWKSNLEQTVGFGPRHISCYSLIIEPETPLFNMIASGEIIPADQELDAALYRLTIDYLESQGYEQYEVSNFARGNSKCRHNLSYWNHTDYLGLGPSAHSFWQNERWWNISDIAGYAKKLGEGTYPLAGGEHLTSEQLSEEAVFLGLRSEGIDLELFRKKFGRDLLTENRPAVKKLVDGGFARLVNGRFRLTSKGYIVCDEICRSL